jgi:hypothetical protein
MQTVLVITGVEQGRLLWRNSQRSAVNSTHQVAAFRLNQTIRKRFWSRTDTDPLLYYGIHSSLLLGTGGLRDSRSKSR